MKRLGLALGILLAIVGLIALMLPLLVNKTAIVSQVLEIIKNSTGADPVVMGEASVSFFPTPKVVMNEVGIRNAPGTATPYVIQLKSVEIYPAITDVFSSNPSISKLVLIDPIFELEKMPDSRLNWAVAFSGTKSTYHSLFNLSKIKSLQLPDVFIKGGLVNYRNSSQMPPAQYQSLEGTFLHGAQGMKLDVNGVYHDVQMSVAATISLTDGNADSPFDVSIRADSHNLDLKGVLKQVGQDVEVEGQVRCKTESIFDLASLLEGNTANDQSTKAEGTPEPESEKPKLPISISSQFHHTLTAYAWKNIAFESEFLKASADLNSNPTEKSSSLVLRIDNLDIDALRASGVAALLVLKKSSKKDTEIGESKNQESLIGVSADEEMDVKITAKNIIVNKQMLSDASIEGSISGPFADISSARIKLPGQGQADFIGTVKQGFQGITYEGTLDAWGQNFKDIMPLFTVDKNFLPDNDFKRFQLKANQVVLSPVEARFIESRLQIEGMVFGGTIVANYGDRLKVESKLAAVGVNFDHFIEHHNDVFSGSEDKPMYLKLPSSISTWLKTLNSEYAIKLVLSKCIFNKENRERADVELLISPSKFNLAKLAMLYNKTKFEFGLTVENIKNQPLPKYGISLVADQLTVAQAPAARNAVESSLPAAPATSSIEIISDNSSSSDGADNQLSSAHIPVIFTGEWSKKEFDVSWLDDIDFAFDIRVGKLQYASWLLNNFSAKGKAENRALTLDAVRANIWGADMAAKVILSGGKLPILSAAFSLDKIAIEQLLQVTPLFSNLSGKFNVSGSVSSSGISPYFMASNLSGKVGVAGRDVKIEGFNLRGIVRSVSAVRSVADILNVVRNAFPGGDTMVDTVQGNFTINKGKAETIGVVLTTNESKGTVKSVLDLVKWKMDTEIAFDLATLDTQRPPKLRILFNGDLESPKKDLDTKSLEEFVALKTKEKYLQDIPTVP